MKIAVIDGQGGRLGQLLIDGLRERLGPDIYIIALGTNAIATAQMNKTGCDSCATGESAICFNVPRADVIAGSVGILCAGSMHGEVSDKMAAAVGFSDAVKVLIPFNRCNIQVVGVKSGSMADHIEAAVEQIASLVNP
jgi:hypothetical protein